MSTVAPRLVAAVPGGRVGARTHVTWTLFMVVATLHTAGVVLQPLLAGAFLAGHFDALAVHSANGGILLTTGWLLVVPAILLCVPGRAPWWVPVLVVAICVAELVQETLGSTRVLAVHLPLGVAIVLTVLGLYAWAIRWRFRLGRAARTVRAGLAAPRPPGPPGPPGPAGPVPSPRTTTGEVGR